MPVENDIFSSYFVILSTQVIIFMMDVISAVQT